jgi:hypothetical protein
VRAVVLAGVLGVIGAQGARELARAEHERDAVEEPYAPSPAAAPILSLGYREAAADVLFFRLIGYFGGDEATAHGVATLVEAIAAVDPGFYTIYEWGARAIVSVRHGLDSALALRAVAVLEQGAQRFPDDYKIPKLAGEILLFDVKPVTEAARRGYRERAARYLEAAIRKPHAPADAATLAADLRSKLGQRQRAVDGLREMVLITSDLKARAQLLEKLAALQQADEADIASELFEARKQFETEWRAERPSLPPTMYLLVGARVTPGFDLRELAAGGRDRVVDLHSAPAFDARSGEAVDLLR